LVGLPEADDRGVMIGQWLLDTATWRGTSYIVLTTGTSYEKLSDTGASDGWQDQ